MAILFSAIPFFKIIGFLAIPLALMGALSYAYNIVASAGAAKVEIAHLARVNEQNRLAAAREKANRLAVLEQSRTLEAELQQASDKVRDVQAQYDALPKWGVGDPCPTDCVLPDFYIDQGESNAKPQPESAGPVPGGVRNPSPEGGDGDQASPVPSGEDYLQLPSHP